MTDQSPNLFGLNQSQATTSCIKFNAPPTEEVLRLDKEGFHYKGEFIADAGEAHRLMVAFLKQNTAQPEPVAPTDEDLEDLAEVMNVSGNPVPAMRRALELWARPAIQPVPVSERLPGPEDCLDEGWAWFFNQRIGWRQAVLPVSPGYTHWLPANALPIPETTND